jgi:dTDP-4-dehydrorhamnose 3,5-epimerase
MVDLRADSPTFKRWFGLELTDENHQMLYVPKGFAHGYQTLTDDAEMCYQTSQFYAGGSARGVRYDDPAFGIGWPLAVSVISEADRRWADFEGRS